MVVIGIVVVLIAILLPAVVRAHAKADTVKCASNLRQIMLGADMYSHDNHGYFPLAHYLDANEIPANSVTGAPALLRKYISNMDVILCPTDPTAIDLFQIYGVFWQIANDMPQYTSYQYNYIVFADSLSAPSHPTNRAQLRQPADLILLYDGSVGTGYAGPWEIIQARHSGPIFNAVFLDDHVESIHAVRSGSAPGPGGGAGGSLPNYTVDRGRRPIYYAGAETIPFRQGGANQGLAVPGNGPIVWGQVAWRVN
jgi:hypothetical protein